MSTSNQPVKTYKESIQTYNGMILPSKEPI
jgi:hypothetical protein